WHAPDLDGKADGNIQTTWCVETQYAGASLELRATGQISAEVATADFTDSAAKVGKVTLGPQTEGSSVSLVTYDVDVYRALDQKGNPVNGKFSVNLTCIPGQNFPSGASASFTTTTLVFGSAKGGKTNLTKRTVLTISTTADVPPGTYDFQVKAVNRNNPAQDFQVGAGTLTVVAATPTNHPPTITKPLDQTNAEAAKVSLQIQASGPASGDTLTYGASNLPAGLSINTATGQITGTIDYTAQGTYTVTVSAMDGKGGIASTNFTWMVTGTDQAPVAVND